MRILLPLTLIAFTSAACSTTATFYPVEGPALRERPKPLKAKASGIMGNSGAIVLERPEGGDCEGEWSSAAGVQTTYTSGSVSGFASSGLISQYGSAHLSGMSVSSGGGQNPGRAVMLCPDGNVIDMEFVTGGGTANGFGIAKDRKGNVYRVLF